MGDLINNKNVGNSLLSNKNESGVIMLFALLAMTGAILFSVSYTSSVTAHMHGSSSTIHRLKAKALANGAVNRAYHSMESGGSMAGTFGPFTYEDGTCTYRVVVNGSEIEVLGSAMVKDQMFMYISEAHLLDSSIRVTQTAEVSGEIRIVDSNIKWGNKFLYGTTIADSRGVFGGQTEQIATLNPISIDTLKFSAMADSTVPTRTVWTDQTCSGNIYCRGDLTINGSFRITGRLMVNGDLIIDGSMTGEARIMAEDEAVIFVLGAVEVKNMAELTISGSIFSEGNISFTDVANFGVKGSLVSASDLTFTRVDGYLEYDPKIQSYPPPIYEVSGGCSQGRVLTEKFRVPYTGIEPTIKKPAMNAMSK